MNQRKLRRKPRDRSAPILHVVPDLPGSPRPRRRRRRFKLPFRAFRANTVAIHAYEEKIVLAVVRQRGGYGSAESLVHEEPERWRRRSLLAVFKRLHRQGYLEKSTLRTNFTTRFDIPKGGQERD